MKNLYVVSLAAFAVAGSMLAPGCGYMQQGKDVYVMYRAPEAARLQTLNPEAGKNHKVVAGLDGAAADQVNKSYVKGFERQTETKAVQTFAGLAGISSN
jgi:hypothetical protein